MYLVEDNGYAISVPVEVNTAGGSISKLLRSYPNLFITEVDGCDFLASYDAMRYAVAYGRERKGPSLVHAHVIRPYPPPPPDDEQLYRPSAWTVFGINEPVGADFRACANFGPLYG